ncbi:MAG: hypothetical protein IJ418_11300 [Clostridia bacterium]|nr:hypothetical protein [Clostridia bacterium]
MPNDFEAKRLAQFAEDIAVKTMHELSVQMLGEPDKHPDYVSGWNRIIEVEHSIEQLLGADANLVYELGEAHFKRSYALAVEIYKRGVLDGGRIYHAMISGDLPLKEVQDEH